MCTRTGHSTRSRTGRALNGECCTRNVSDSDLTDELLLLCYCRRKPQNLTPPLSSDGGSSTSGQSPKSTHSSMGGSPSQQGKRSMVGNAGDEKLDGPNAKKPRVSHFVKAPDTR